MPAYNGRIAIVGIAESDYGRVPNMTELQLHAQTIHRALEDSGLSKKDIDGVFCSSDTMSMPTVTLIPSLFVSIGNGIHHVPPEQARELLTFLKRMEQYLSEHGVLQAIGFRFVGGL
jgi:hypothetical protein